MAKRDEVRQAFSKILERRDVYKVYESLLLGATAWDETEVEAAIAPVGDSRILMCVDDEAGKPARSVFAVLARFRHATHVSIRIYTGRTHQIRVHAAHLGHPCLGDHLYGDGIPIGRYGGFTLHAREIRFDHPVTGEPMRIVAPLPRRFEEALALLGSSV